MIAERPIDKARASVTAWHATSIDRVAALLDTGRGGLSSKAAAARLIADGPNALPPPPGPSVLLLFVRQFNSPLIYLLIAAAAVSLGLGHRTDAGFIGVVLLVNAAIGTVQESKAASSLAALGRMIGQTATVRLDDAVSVIDARDIVVGDVVELESGMVVFADIRLSSSSALSVDQSTFTGESAAVFKDHAGLVHDRTPPGERETMALAGTMIEQGARRRHRRCDRGGHGTRRDRCVVADGEGDAAAARHPA